MYTTVQKLAVGEIYVILFIKIKKTFFLFFFFHYKAKNVSIYLNIFL